MKKSTAEPKTASKPVSQPETQPTAGGSLIYAIIGILFGLVVGFVLTNSLNSGSAPPASPGMAKAGPLKGNEKMPEGHPQVSDAEIEQEIQTAVKYGKENPDYDAQLKVGSYLYMQTHRLEIAKPFLLKAHELKPGEYEPLVQLGNITFDLAQETNNLKLMPEAADWYEQALKIKPDEVSVQTDLGLTYQLREPPDFTKAISYYEKTLAKEPNHTVALYNKARALLGLKRLDEAEAAYDKIKDNTSNPELIKKLREDLDKAKKPDSIQIPTH